MDTRTRYRLNSGEVIEVYKDVLYVFTYLLEKSTISWYSSSCRKRRKVITQGFGMNWKYFIRIEYYDPNRRRTCTAIDVSPIPIQGTSDFFEHYTKI